jgi:DNA-binding transcriptional regulator YiaG
MGMNTWTPEKIKELRGVMGLSQTAFAALFPVDYHSVGYWERGKVKPGRMIIKQLDELANEIKTREASIEKVD